MMVMRPVSDAPPPNFRRQRARLVSGGLLIAALFALVGIWKIPGICSILFAAGGAICTLWGQETKRRLLLWVGIAQILLVAVAQVAAVSQSSYEASQLRDMLRTSLLQLDSTHRELVQARKDSSGFSAEIANLQRRILDKSETNEALNRKLAAAQARAIEAITGGNSFCYVSFLFGKDNQARLVALHSGKNPVSDLEIRYSDLSPDRGHTVTVANLFETSFHIGTLAVRDFRAFGAIPLPRGAEGQCRFDFSARNGLWSQVTIIRRKAGGEWRSLTQVLGRQPRIVKFAELKQLENPQRVCMQRDTDFPVKSEGEVLDWLGGRMLPRCADVVGF